MRSREFVATPGRVVLFVAFLSVHVLYPVLVFIYFFHVRSLSVVVQEKLDAVVDFYASSLEEQPILQSTVVLEFMLLHKRLMHLKISTRKIHTHFLHAEREVFFAESVNIRKRNGPAHLDHVVVMVHFLFDHSLR